MDKAQNYALLEIEKNRSKKIVNTIAYRVIKVYLKKV